MGVINMAHGELMMIGAYATYWCRACSANLPARARSTGTCWRRCRWPSRLGLMGAVLERTVIRFLYGRPLETLLATWGISLMLMQAVRTLFGAQNVGVENPGWMSGGVVCWQPAPCRGTASSSSCSRRGAGGMAWLIARTRLGLFVRGVTQNRPMASCMGVNTARVDTYAFALGSGIAGLAGCALSQVGNVGPDLGQAYIVDSFMVVVLGGVGQLAGTVYAARWGWACSTSSSKAGPARCWPRSPCWCSSWCSSRSGRRACSRSKAGARRHERGSGRPKAPPRCGGAPATKAPGSAPHPTLSPGGGRTPAARALAARMAGRLPLALSSWSARCPCAQPGRARGQRCT
jgi:urea ABC transporter permease protein UrtB